MYRRGRWDIAAPAAAPETTEFPAAPESKPELVVGRVVRSEVAVSRIDGTVSVSLDVVVSGRQATLETGTLSDAVANAVRKWAANLPRK